MTRVSFDDSYEPPAPVLPVRVGGLEDHDPAAMLRMLVDTGADCTLIPLKIAKSLRLPMVDKVSIQGVGGKTQQASVHAARVRVGKLRVLARVVALGDEALLGRDVLNRMVVQLDGPGQTIDATPPPPRPKRARR
jgi:predicted aspartyl protease